MSLGPALAPETLARVDRYWASFFGCAPEQLRGARPVVLPHSRELADYAGVYLQSFGAAPLLSLPPSLLHEHGPVLARAARSGLAADERWAAALGSMLGVIVGRAWIGYADARTLRAPSSSSARPITSADVASVERLRAACTPTERAHTGDGGEEVAVGVFEGGELASLAGYQVWDGCIAHLSILTHPARRGRGFGREAVAALARTALERGLIPQYRVLADNAPSHAVAAAAGFHSYATSLALRLAAV